METAACPCIICSGADAGQDADVVRHMRKPGWSVAMVAGEVEFAYTIGLWHTFRRPEVVMFGLHGEGMHQWLNTCVEYGRDHGWPAKGEQFAGVLDRFPVQLRPVHASWHDALFGAARRFYQGATVPILQLVWPDRNGIWPWQEGATMTSRTRQPFAWLPVAEHPAGGRRLYGEMGADFPFYVHPFHLGPDTYTFTSRSLLEGSRPLTRIVRHGDSFDVLDERGYDADDLCWEFLGDLFRRHSDLASFAELAEGQAATLGGDGIWTTAEWTSEEHEMSTSARDAIPPPPIAWRSVDSWRMNDERPGFVKVGFRLEQDEDGWPPAASEGLWAAPIGDDAYLIDSTPWFARNVAAGDVFLAKPDADGRRWAGERLYSLGNCTIRIIPFKDGPLAGSQQAVLDLFVPLGASGAGFGSDLDLVALTIPPQADLAEIKRILQRGEVDGSWTYEESCIGDEWASA
jgi:hypothetical protein